MTDSTDTVSDTVEATVAPDPIPAEADSRPDTASGPDTASAPDATSRPDTTPTVGSPRDPVTPGPETAQRSEPSPEPRGSALPAVLGGLVAAVIGFGLAQVVPQGWPLSSNAGVTAEIATQQAAIAALQAQLQDLSDAPAPKPDPALADRVTAVEAALVGLPPLPDTAPLLQRLDAVESQLSNLQSAPTATGSVDPAALTALRAEVEALKSGGSALDSKVAEAEARLASIKSEAEALSITTATRAALRQVQAALDSGAPYAAALADLPLDIPEVLKTNAAAGVPSLQSLRAAYPGAARAALDAALRASASESWTERLGIFLRGQTGARSLTPREGSDPDAILSRAEAALTAGDLTTATVELEGLPQAGKDAMSGWMAQAAMRQKAIAAVQDLSARAGQ